MNFQAYQWASFSPGSAFRRLGYRWCIPSPLFRLSNSEPQSLDTRRRRSPILIIETQEFKLNENHVPEALGILRIK